MSNASRSLVRLASIGFIGLNNLKNTDYINVVVQTLAHIPPLRDFFLRSSDAVTKSKSQLVHRFGELLRKMWSPHNFKNTVCLCAGVDAFLCVRFVTFGKART